jgi:hypothetical protein
LENKILAGMIAAIVFTPRCGVFKKHGNRLNRACHWNAPKHHSSNPSAIMSAAKECFKKSLKNGSLKWWGCILEQSKKSRLEK